VQRLNFVCRTAMCSLEAAFKPVTGRSSPSSFVQKLRNSGL